MVALRSDNEVPRWGLVPNSSLHWKIWDDHCVVFNSASGQTHLLDPVPALLLRQIDDGCSDFVELISRTTELLEVDLTPEVRRALEQTLEQLDNLGFIEPATT